MPLTGSPSHDIPKLKSEGYEQKQAVAIALSKERGDKEDCDDDRKDDKEADSKKDQSPPGTLLGIVERIRGDMSNNREALDKLTSKMYNASSRVRRIEQGT